MLIFLSLYQIRWHPEKSSILWVVVCLSGILEEEEEEEVRRSYLDTSEMQVHDTGHVETHTQHQQQQHQHPPERAEDTPESERLPSFPLTTVKTPSL